MAGPQPQPPRGGGPAQRLEALYQMRAADPGDSAVAVACVLGEMILGATTQLEQDLGRIERSLEALERRTRLASARFPDRAPGGAEVAEQPYHDGA